MKRSITHDRAPNYIWYADKLISQGGVPVKITIQAFMLLYEIKMGCTFEYTETLWFNDEPENSPSGQYKCECPLIDEVKKLLASPLVDNIVICYVNDAVGFVACARQAIPAFSMLAIYAGDIVNKNQKDKNSAYLFDFTQLTNRDKSSENSHSIDAKKRGGIARFFAHLPHKTEKLISVDYSKAEQIRILQLLGMGGGLDVISNYVPFDAKTFADKIYEIERAVDHSSVNKKNKNDFLQGFSSLKLLLQKAMSPASLSELDVYLEKKASNYVQTMNFQQRTWHYDMTRLLWPVEVATENLGRNTVLINGVPVSFLFAKRDIEIGEVLGFDYGLGYWVHKNCLPLLLNKDGSILPESQYRYMFMWLESTRAEAKLLNEKITYCCTRDAYFSNVDTQLPLQIGVFEKPRSFFEVRDLFVENNVLPIFHGAITSVYFAEQLRRLFSSISSVVVKAYYHDPDTGEELAQYSVDVVCRFSEFRQWAHLTSWIKPQPIKQFVKCYEHSQEIIFRGVNVDKMPEMMQTLCNTLQSKMPLSEWLNQEHWHRQPSARSIFYESRDGRYCCISMPE